MKTIPTEMLIVLVWMGTLTTTLSVLNVTINVELVIDLLLLVLVVLITPEILQIIVPVKTDTTNLV